MQNWKQVKKELKALGIKVNVSIKSCCLGCNENPIAESDEPAIYQLSKRFSSSSGGYLCHQNIGDTVLASKVMVVFNSNQISWKWDGTQARSILVGEWAEAGK